jgi:multicomponent Na+:H+ antiporter subunit A
VAIINEERRERLMLRAVLSGFALARIAPWVQQLGSGRGAGVLSLLPLGLFLFFGHHLLALDAHAVYTVTYDWIPSLGIRLSFYADGLSLLLALLISGIGTLVVVYAGVYLGDHPHRGRFYAYLMMFMAAMLGLVLSDNVLTLYVFWELTSLSSYLLIGFEHEHAEARDAAGQALLVTTAGGLALLAGLVLLGQAGEAWEFSVLLTRHEMLLDHTLYVPIVLLLLLGAFTKSAQMPFHFWLPNAMEAPTPVSAYLHSATMVKAGIYLLARCSPILGGTTLWQSSITIVGTVTMLVSAYMAIQQTDLKRILAYATVSALGLKTLLLGVGTSAAVKAAITYLLVHALYKGALFLIAGAVDHETGRRDVTQLGGLGRPMPLTALAAGLAALSMAGIFPFVGFIGKELVYEAVLQAPFWTWVLSSAVVLASMLFVAVAGVAGLRPFLGPRPKTLPDLHDAPLLMSLAPLILAGAGIGAGLQSTWFGKVLLAPAAAAVLGHAVTIELALWHGWNLVFTLSLVTLLGGVVIYAGRGPLRQAAVRWKGVAKWGPGNGYDLGLRALQATAWRQTRLLQSGYLRYYVLLSLMTLVGLVGWTLLQWDEVYGLGNWSDIRFYEVWLAGLILIASLATVRARSRLGAVAALGVVGYGVALIFVLFGAPDLAMTQFLVESLTVILFVLVFYQLPDETTISNRTSRFRDLVVATTVGGMMAALVWLMHQVQWYASISAYFAENSLEQAHGRNIVNVILVDFRNLDTLGEITVLTVAGLGVYALIKLRLTRGGKP